MTQVNKLNIIDQVMQYLATKKYGEPLLLTDIVYKLSDNDEFRKTRNTISAYLNRLVRKGELKKYEDGMFYKAKTNVFGQTPINTVDLINKLYIYDEEKKERFGYRIGANVLANIGITNNLENRIVIVTNNYNRRKVLNKINQNIDLKKPVIKVNDINYFYLQLLDTIMDIDKYHLIDENVGKRILTYLNNNNMEINELFKYAKELYSKKVITNLIELLTM